MQAPAARVEAASLDDQRMASDVAVRLSGDARFTAVRITALNGVVFLTGAVDSAATGAHAAQIAQQVIGVRQVVNQLQLAPAVPPSGGAVMAGHPPVDAQGVVAAYDPQTRIVTFQDGRMLRVQPGDVWQLASTDGIQPGRQIYARNAEPVGVQTSLAPSQAGAWRIGTVDRVDMANGLLYFRDGGIVGVNAFTPVTMNGQRVTASQIRSGAQVAVRMPETMIGGSALPRSVAAPPASAAEIFVY